MNALTDEKVRRLAGLGEKFRSAQPFPNVVVDDFLEPEPARDILREFRDTSEGAWKYYHHYNEKKRAVTEAALMGPATRRFLEEAASPRFIAALEELSGIKGLLWDPDLDGAGLHETRRGGFLNVHVDFASHTTRKTWSRQLNLILFLNESWREEYAGGLELWDRQVKKCAVSVPPVFNRAVIFRTGAISWHGVPSPVLCPEGESRKSIALYYFREEGAPLKLSPTYYQPRPEDSRVKSLLIVADRLLLRGYSFLKRYVGVVDRAASRLMKRL